MAYQLPCRKVGKGACRVRHLKLSTMRCATPAVILEGRRRSGQHLCLDRVPLVKNMMDGVSSSGGPLGWAGRQRSGLCFEQPCLTVKSSSWSGWPQVYGRVTSNEEPRPVGRTWDHNNCLCSVLPQPGIEWWVYSLVFVMVWQKLERIEGT